MMSLLRGQQGRGSLLSAEENKAVVLQRLRSGALRLRSAWLPILQTAVAPCLAWFLAVLILGLERPTFAPIVVVLTPGPVGGVPGSCSPRASDGVRFTGITGQSFLLL